VVVITRQYSNKRLLTEMNDWKYVFVRTAVGELATLDVSNSSDNKVKRDKRSKVVDFSIYASFFN